MENYQQRDYPYGAELAHVVGYVSKINDSDLQRLAKNGEAENYAADHNIGKQALRAITNRSCTVPPATRRSRWITTGGWCGC
nr:cell elongation, e phase; peptidoglycan synthetase; penicillin-binding protein 2 [Raoultella sp. NCTC 9187]